MLGACNYFVIYTVHSKSSGTGFIKNAKCYLLNKYSTIFSSAYVNER